MQPFSTTDVFPKYLQQLWTNLQSITAVQAVRHSMINIISMFILISVKNPKESDRINSGIMGLLQLLASYDVAQGLQSDWSNLKTTSFHREVIHLYYPTTSKNHGASTYPHQIKRAFLLRSNNLIQNYLLLISNLSTVSPPGITRMEILNTSPPSLRMKHQNESMSSIKRSSSLLIMDSETCLTSHVCEEMAIMTAMDQEDTVPETPASPPSQTLRRSARLDYYNDDDDYDWETGMGNGHWSSNGGSPQWVPD